MSAAAFLWRDALEGAVPARLDLADFFWPMKAYTAARWSAGTVPLWNPLAGCGEPWLAQLQTGGFYPGDLPFFLPLPWGPLLGIALHLGIAAAGMAAWLDDLGTSRPAAFLGAAVFSSAGGFVSLFAVYNNACSAAYLPWIFLGARRLVRGETAVTLAFATSMAFLAGEPALAIAGAVMASITALVTRKEGETRAPEPVRRPMARVAGALALALGVVAAVAMPFAELVAGSSRLTSVTREEAVARGVTSSDLGDLVAPQSAAAARSFREGRGGYLISLALGPAPLLLACGCVAGFPGRRRLLGVLLAFGALGLLAALGDSGLLVPILHAAGLNPLRFPARWFVLTHLFIGVAAAAGLDGWLYGRFRRSPGAGADTAAADEDEPYSPRPALLAAVAGFGVLALVVLLAFGDAGARRGPRLALVAGASALVALGVVHARLRGTSPAFARAIALAAVLPLPFIASDPLDSVPARDVSGRPAVLGAPAENAGRVFVPVHDPALFSMWYGSAGGWTPALARRTHEALAGYTNLGADVATATSASPIGNPRVTRLLGAALAGGNPRAILGLADVGTIVSPFPPSIPGVRRSRAAEGVVRYDVPGRIGRVFFPRSAVVADDEETFAALRRPDFDPLARAYVAAAGGPLPPAVSGRAYAVARVVRDEPELLEIAVDSSQPGLAVVTRSFDRGWQAMVDDVEGTILRTNLAFMGLTVPAGEHRIVMRYRPASFRVGAAISAFSLLVLVSLWLAGGPRR